MSNFNRKKGKLRVAYGCFLFSGSIFALIGLISFIPMNTGTAGGIGLIFLVPLSIVAVVAICCGLILSYWLRPHVPLTVLSIASLVFIAEVISEAGPPLLYNSISIIYGTTSIGIPLWWFSCKHNRFVDIV